MCHRQIFLDVPPPDLDHLRRRRTAGRLADAGGDALLLPATMRWSRDAGSTVQAAVVAALHPCPTASCSVQSLHRASSSFLACSGPPAMPNGQLLPSRNPLRKPRQKIIYFAPSWSDRTEMCCLQIVYLTLSSMNYLRLQIVQVYFKKKNLLVTDLNTLLYWFVLNTGDWSVPKKIHLHQPKLQNYVLNICRHIRAIPVLIEKPGRIQWRWVGNIDGKSMKDINECLINMIFIHFTLQMSMNFSTARIPRLVQTLKTDKTRYTEPNDSSPNSKWSNCCVCQKPLSIKDIRR
jgi:hypothetical protein